MPDDRLFKSGGPVPQSLGVSDGVVLHGTPQRDSMRERIVPMISEALKRTPLIDVELIGWDYVAVPMTNAIVVGVAIAIRGYDLAGPGRELMQFRPFSTWQPSQTEVNSIVAAIIEGLRESRNQQKSTLA